MPICVAVIALLLIGQSFTASAIDYNDIRKDNFFIQDTVKKGDSLALQIIKDSQSVIKDTLRDSLIINSDSLKIKDSLRRRGSLSFPVFSKAKDSIIEDFSNGKKMFYYYGDVTVKYEDMEIKSAYMAYDVENRSVYASGIKDTAGVLQGTPEMTSGGKTYKMEEVTYNFKSKKARMTNMLTQEAEGILHGERLKKLPDNSVNIKGAKYTACDLDHPHYYLNMTVAKVGENQSTVFGPAYFVLEDVPLPLALPFGFVPKRQDRSGGLLIPTYGEEVARGFFLRGLGYYFVFGDNFDASVTGDFYTLGSWNMLVTSRYKKRYKYEGNFNFNYSNNQVGEKGGADFYQSKDFSVQWSHSQDPKAWPGSTFRASVNFSTPLNNRFNTTDIQNSLQNQISSSVSFSRTWAGTPFSFSTNIMHSQNSLDSSYAVTFPNFRFEVRTIYPFRKKERTGKKRLYEDISFRYSTSFDNKINFKAKEFNTPEFWSKFKSGMNHNFSISLPSFSVFRYVQLSPSILYGMNWYFQKNEKTYNQELKKVEDNYSKLFNHFGVTQDFSASLSANTTIYGTFNFRKGSAIKAVRHVINPSLSFSFKPEMGTPWNGYTTLSYVDANGIQHIDEYNKYSGQIYGPPSRGRTAALGFSIGNTVEAKVKNDNDTTGTGDKIVSIIKNLAIGGSYNFVADSMKLSNITMNMSTNIFGKLALNANAAFDPYAVDSRGRRINRFNIAQEGGLNLARLVNASLSFSYQFSGEGKSNRTSSTPTGGGPAGEAGQGGRSGNLSNSVKHEEHEYTRVYYHPVTGEYIPGGWVYYLEPNIPWSVNFNYNYSYSRNYQYVNSQLNTIHNHTQALGVSAQVRFTKALNINVNTGIDLMKMALTTTQLSATYDLHCFLISFSWVPSGQWQSWSFRINAKASALADLLQFKKNASFWDR